MGTKVEGKTYMPGYFAMGDFSMNSNGSCLQFYEGKRPNGVYDSLTIMPTNGSSEYDKEMLKRTMLMHEATFRKQVYELHRLYKIQKDLMAQFQNEDFNGYSRPVDILQSRSFSSQGPSRDTKRTWQIGNDNRQPSLNFMNESSSQYSLNGAPVRFDSSRSTKKMLDLQLPADAYADSDEVEIVEEQPARNFSRTSGGVLGGNFKLSVGKNESSLCRENGWISDLRSHNNRSGYAVTDLNKMEAESADTKLTDYFSRGTSGPHNDHYSSKQVNSNCPFLEGGIRARKVDEASDSSFFVPIQEIRQHSLFSNKENDQNVSMAWFRKRPNGAEESMGNYFASSSTSDQPVLSSPAPFVALGAPLEKNNRNYSAATASTQIARSGIGKHPSLNGFGNGFSLDSIHMQQAPHLLKTPGKEPGEDRYLSSQYPKHSQDANCRKDVHLGFVTADRVQGGTPTDSKENGCENSPHEISWLRKKPAGAEPADLKKSQMASNLADGHSKILFSLSTVAHDSRSDFLGQDCRSGRKEEGTATRILGVSVSATVEKGTPCSPSPCIGTTTEASAVHSAQLEMQTHQGKKVEVNVRILIDLNDALPCMDDPEIDVCQSEDNTVSREPDNSSDSLAVAAAENLIAISKDVRLAVSPPQLHTLLWFAEVATSKNMLVSNGDSDHGSGDLDYDEFEALTLQLEEAKGYEYSCKPRTPENEKDEGRRSVASLLLTRPRRGQARRRRQKKDFQKDILPGLASLSRQEVSDDIQTLGGLIKASGRAIPAAPTRRGGRNGSQRRGRRRSRTVGVTVEVVQASNPPLPPPLGAAVASLDADGQGIMGWGRTTRRCRRPRCPPANNASVH